MSSYLDRGLIGHDAFRHSGMFWFDLTVNLWVPVDQLHPLPVALYPPIASNGAMARIVTVLGVEGGLLAALATRLDFIVYNLGPGTVFVRPVTAGTPAPATVLDYPIAQGGTFKGGEHSVRAWRYIDDGVNTADLRIMVSIR